MSEPNVQVPVSLIKAAARHLDREGYPGTASMLNDALLSQPTPSAEPTDAQVERFVSIAKRFPPSAALGKAWNDGWSSGWANRHQVQPDRDGAVGLSRPIENPYSVQVAEPPRIEDMAPGTRFRDSEGAWWTVRRTEDGDTWANGDDGDAWDLLDFDPSTIRDVTPPKGDERG